MKKVLLGIFCILSMGTYSIEGKAPEIDLKDQYGIEHKLEEYRGKIVFLNFWVSWCPTYRNEIPAKKKLFKEYGENQRDVVILGINNEDEKTIKSFINQKEYKLPTLLGANKEFEIYEIKKYPTTYVIDRDGTIVKKLNEEKLNSENMKKIIEEIDNKSTN